MTQSPRKFVSAYTSSTTNRGVEAKEVEIANTHLDTDGSSQYQESDMELRSQASDPRYNSTRQNSKVYYVSRPQGHFYMSFESTGISQVDTAAEKKRRKKLNSDTGSYLQVVVQKHKKRDPTAAATQTSPRLPVASSPLKPTRPDTQLYLLQHPMLVAYPNAPIEERSAPIEKTKRSFWSKFKEATNETAPDKVDLYYFEKNSGEFLATSDGTFTYSESFAAQISRIPNRVVAEVFAVPQIIAGIPVAIILNLERSIFVVLRGLVVGSVQIWSDYVLKPLLTLSFNAVIQPPLVFAGNVGRAFRNAVKPVAEMVGDFLEPVVKVLSAIKLVNVEKCRCTHTV